MKKLGVTMMGAALGMTGLFPMPRPATPTRSSKKRKVKKWKKPLPNHYSRSKYIPAGEYRNCGEDGISPKLVRRKLSG